MKSLPVELKKVRDTVAACGWRECVKSIDSILVGAEAVGNAHAEFGIPIIMNMCVSKIT